MYLPEELKIKELHTFYDKHSENKVGNTTFRDIFKQKFYASLTSDETGTVEYADYPPMKMKFHNGKKNKCEIFLFILSEIICVTTIYFLELSHT